MNGKHNDNLSELEGTLPGEAIADELAAVGLMEMGVNFLPWSKPWLEDSYMEHAEGWTRGPVPDGIYLQKIPQTVPGRGHPGPATQLGPLHGTGLSERGANEGFYGLPT